VAPLRFESSRGRWSPLRKVSPGGIFSAKSRVVPAQSVTESWERYCATFPHNPVPPMTLPTLSLLETRILGVLVEKQHTVPDSYPLSLNALTLGCNQKTARDPVINASEGDVLAALDTLKSLHIVLEGSGSRVPRFEHNVARVLRVPGRPADRGRTAAQHRAPASLRRHLLGRRLSRRTRHA